MTKNQRVTSAKAWTSRRHLPGTAVASSRPAPAGYFEQLDWLAAEMSAHLAHLRADDVVRVIPKALGQIAAAAGVASCRLIELTEPRAVVHEPLASEPGDIHIGGTTTPQAWSWLTDRVAAGETVVVGNLDEDPTATFAAREQARRSGAFTLLGLPASAAGQVSGVLVVQGTRRLGCWSQPLIQRLQLMADMLAATLRRCRDESTLRASVAEVERLNERLQADNGYLREEIKNYHDFDEIVGESAALRLALTRLSQVAPLNSSVLLQGPTGSGKELFARAVHARSRRHARAFVRVNCAALPPTLVESELFGHEKGAFTGAVATRQGRFELADGGTIFLDEIGDLSLDSQIKFLRVLQEGEFERVGSCQTRQVDVRVIAATHRDLEAAVADGTFRADLFYRLSVYPISLPSLAERTEDIPRLVWVFVHRLQHELGRRITTVPDTVMQTLMEHGWPGNVRELENVVERAMIASQGAVLQLDDTFVVKRQAGPAAEQSDRLDAVERSHIEAVLRKCGWRINGLGNAAERLGLHPNTLRFRMKKLAVVCPPGRDRRQRSAQASIT
jgi:formate hydrogenlyase transcriptional activator